MPFNSPASNRGRLFLTLVEADQRFDNTREWRKIHFDGLCTHCNSDPDRISEGLLAIGGHFDSPSGYLIGEIPNSHFCVIRTAHQLFKHCLLPRVKHELTLGRHKYGRPVDPTNNKSMADSIQFLVENSWDGDRWTWRYFDPAALLRSSGGNYFWVADSAELADYTEKLGISEASVTRGWDTMRAVGQPFFGPFHPGVPDDAFEGIWQIELSERVMEFYVPSIWDSKGFLYFMPGLVELPRSGRTVYLSHEAPITAFDGVREWVHPSMSLREAVVSVKRLGVAERIAPPSESEPLLLGLIQQRMR